MRVFLFLLALAAPATAQEARIVVLGDSIMEWNGESSVAAVMQREFGQRVRDESVSGAQFSHRMRLLVGPMDIRAQLPGRGFEWVVMTGGGNDLAVDCDCNACADVLDGLITADGTLGDIPDFAEQVTASGTNILWAQYYDAPLGGGPFSACADEFAELATRLNRLANRLPGVHVTDLGGAIDPSDLTLYDPDRLHPSPEGSALIGRWIAREINALSRRSN
ncbi:MAG: SGNH/GDSL hydrolase family protein [Pseudomonadota bacterium]